VTAGIYLKPIDLESTKTEIIMSSSFTRYVSVSTRLITALSLIILVLCQTGCNDRIMTTRSGLQYKKIAKGTGAKAKTGQEILLFETTRYRNGTILYSNEGTTTPVKVLIGGNQATQAVDEALVGMKAGEVKEIIAPPYLVKRKDYPPNVHPDSTLVIKLILHKIL
jgi:FKBP-type peptidyl-prolyl cis-trans isomerase